MMTQYLAHATGKNRTPRSTTRIASKLQVFGTVLSRDLQPSLLIVIHVTLRILQ
jgi:hypothetical protein